MATRLPAEQRRRQLLDISCQVFAERGFHATSMDDVASKAGVTKPVLYQHFPSKRALLDARNRVFARHPGTTFVALHVANHPEDLDEVERVLDRYPNVVVETGARHAELGRQPRRARAFFLKYPDRILFGTDASPEEAMYRNWFRFLETADESFDYWNAPGQGRWTISGLDLPRDVLEKVYAKNAERVIPTSPAP